MTEEQIEAGVRQFVTEKFMYAQGGETLGNNMSLLDRGLIDSTGVLELVFFLEQTYGIKVADEEMLPDNLDSIDAIRSYVRRKLSTAA
jgi:acyl carrier protein